MKEMTWFERRVTVVGYATIIALAFKCGGNFQLYFSRVWPVAAVAQASEAAAPPRVSNMSL